MDCLPINKTFKFHIQKPSLITMLISTAIFPRFLATSFKGVSLPQDKQWDNQKSF